MYYGNAGTVERDHLYLSLLDLVTDGLDTLVHRSLCHSLVLLHKLFSLRAACLNTLVDPLKGERQVQIRGLARRSI